MSEVKNTSVEATLDGKKITIQKLKAGKYYEAQQLYVGMIDKIRNKVNVKELPNKEKEDEKLEDLIDKGSLDISSLYSIFPTEIVKLVAFCMGVEADKLLNEAYPEEISDLATKVIKLNNFNQNLKNSIAPLASLGAEK